eukprot:Sspe_Gene.100893::Locus_75539_Transcript_2_2_Confidence_0.667_Length_1640::g.100893::m.100893/K07375/TUBB; tubulin beta
MREVISVHVGGGGNNLGTKFWEVVCDEHSITTEGAYAGVHDYQKDSLAVYFNEVMGRYVPRAVLVDTDPDTSTVIHESPYGGIFRPNNLIFGAEGASRNFIKGFDASIIESAVVAVKKELEACDSVEALQITASLGGGCGGGTTAKLVRRLAEELEEIWVFGVLPAFEVSQEVLCAAMSISALHDYDTRLVCFDNPALHRSVSKLQGINPVTFGDMNHLVATVMAAVSSCMRFDSQLSCGMRKIPANIANTTTRSLYGQIQFYVPSIAPLYSRTIQQYTNRTPRELIEQSFHPLNSLVSLPFSRGMYLSAVQLFRGAVSLQSVNHLIAATQEANSGFFNFKDQSCIKTAVCNIPPPGLPLSLCCIATHSQMGWYLQTLCDLARDATDKGHCHWKEDVSETFVSDNLRKLSGKALQISEVEKAREKAQEIVEEEEEIEEEEEDVGG